MRRSGNPFLHEGARTYFSHAAILRSYLFLVGGLALAIILWWPRGTLESALWAGRGPDTFTMVAIVFLLCLMYLGSRYGSEDYSPDSLGQLEEYATLTPVPLFALVAGKAVFGLLHTLFLLFLGAPFLLASLAVTGTGIDQALEALLVVGAAAFAARIYGLFLLTLLPARQLLRDLALLVSVALFVALSTPLLPAASPVAALLSLSAAAMVQAAPIRLPFGSIPFFSFSVILNLAAAFLLAGGALARLRSVRRRARTRNNGQD